MRVDQLSMHGFDKGAADRIGRALRGIVERGFATGNSIAIGRGGARVYEEYCGYADLARTAPVDESTKFRVYSMTKVVTAVAVMQLWEQGVFSLNDPVSAYIPSFAAPNVGRRRADGSWELRPAAREIMVRDLLTMTSGIPYTGDDPAGRGMDELVRRWRAEQEAGRPWDTVRVAEEGGTLPLMFDPGSYYNYGFSFDILGALIQIWTGLTLAQYLSLIHILNTRLRSISGAHTERALARYLCGEYENAAQGDTVHVRIPYAELAKQLNMGRASLYRAFDALEAQGLIHKQGRSIAVLDAARLKAL